MVLEELFHATFAVFVSDVLEDGAEAFFGALINHLLSDGIVKHGLAAHGRVLNDFKRILGITMLNQEPSKILSSSFIFLNELHELAHDGTAEGSLAFFVRLGGQGLVVFRVSTPNSLDCHRREGSRFLRNSRLPGIFSRRFFKFILCGLL